MDELIIKLNIIELILLIDMTREVSSCQCHSAILIESCKVCSHHVISFMSNPIDN